MATEVRFWKFYVEGNSYVVVDRPECVAALCGTVNDGLQGIGGDGVLLAEWRGQRRIGMRVFNADGSEAPMCGNGARSLAALAHRRNPALGGGDVVVEAAGGTVVLRAVGSGGQVFESTLALDAPPIVEVPVPGVVYRARLGVPHTVVFRDLSSLALEEEGPLWERSMPGGTNVMFASVAAPGVLDVIPWERGVGAVKGCATGAAATAIAAADREDAWPENSIVRQPGGTVGVRWIAGQNRLVLTGSARLVADGHLFI